MFETLKEVLKKPFLSDAKPKPSTLTATENDIDIRLASSEYDLPYANNKRGNYNIEERNRTYNSDIYIKQYRRMSIIPEVSSAIDEIQNEALGISIEGSRVPTITFEVDNGKVLTPKSAQAKVIDAWGEIMKILRFQQKGKDIFRQWYVDGKIVAELVYDEAALTKGIQQVFIISPLGFRRNIEETGSGKNKTLKITYKYESNARQSLHGTTETFLNDQIVISTSGMKYQNYDIGYLYSAIKPSNNLVMIEDSILIYRVMRAVETRVWNVNIGRMPKQKAENYLNTVISEIKNDIAYDSITGEFKGYTDMKSLINDFVFPSRGTAEATSVSTIGGNTNFIESMEDLKVFLKKLYLALKIPVNRLDDTNTLDFSADDILRAEEKFLKTINDIQISFSSFLLELLKRHCIAKKILSESEWPQYESEIKIIFQAFGNNQIVEKARMNSLLKKAETTKELEDSGIIGKVLSYEYVIRNIWNMTKEEFEEQQKMIEQEKKDGWFYSDKDEEVITEPAEVTAEDKLLTNVDQEGK